MADSVPLGIAVAGSCKRKYTSQHRGGCYVRSVPLLSFSLYFKVSRDVGSRQDAGGGGEENGKHLEKAAFRSSPVWF